MKTAKFAPGPLASKTRKNVHAEQGASLAIPTLIFTGERHEGHYQVVVKSQNVMLPPACLQALLKLVLARAGPGTGFVRLKRLTVFRLRKALATAVGPGAGQSLIETGGTQEYRLTIARHQLAAELASTPSFAELVDLNVVAKQQAVMLKGVCGTVTWSLAD